MAEFAGALSDTRSKFLEWGEDIKDRTALYDQKVADAMTAVENRAEAVTELLSKELGVGPQENAELQGYLRDRTKGTAGASSETIRQVSDWNPGGN